MAIKNFREIYFFGLKKIRQLFLITAYHGVANEKDESNQKYIIQTNLISSSTFVINIIVGILFCCLVDASPGISFMLSGIMWLLPIYINRNGLTVFATILLDILTLSALLGASCWYTHNTMLDSYFLIVAINATFLYTPKQRNWQMAVLFLASALFIIESTHLQNYLPAYNTLKFNPATNNILLSGEVMTILVDVIIYAYVSHLRETNLIAKQKQLEKTQALVQIQNDDLKTFSIAASHTMQTPLHVSSFFLEKIEKELHNNGNEETGNNIKLVRNGLEQIDQLVSGLFSYNRIINIENELTAFDATEEINIVKKNINLRHPNAGITINKKDFFITANQLLFSTIIYNLIDNGIKYNLSQPEIKIDCFKTKTNIVLLVTDNGVGISEKYFSTIFEPFKRVQKNNFFKPGNGLGLACAKRAAERMDGTLICLQSNQGGSVFKLEIPLA